MISRTVHLVVLLFCFFVHPAAFAANATVKFNRLIVLGDSLSDQGNLFAATSALGPSLGLAPIPRSDYYHMGRFSNGENYADVLAEKLGITLTPSQLGGSNYAFGGSRTDYNRLEASAPPQAFPGPSDRKYPTGAYPWSLDLQREAFLGDTRRHADPKGLYIVIAGSNDLSDAFIGALLKGQDPGPIIQKTVIGIMNVIAAFASAGAPTILVGNLPNLGVVPAVTALGNTPAEKAQIQRLATGLSLKFNEALSAIVSSMSNTTNANIIVFDTFSLLTDVVRRPHVYGLTNATQPCYSGFVESIPGAPAPTVCAEPHHYAFWDGEHPSARLHEILAEALYTSVLHCDATHKNGKHPLRGRFTAHCAVNGR